MRLLKKYQNLDHSEIMFHPDLAHDIALIKEELPDINSQDEVRQFLLTLLEAINIEIDAIKNKLKDRSSEMDTIERNAKACVAYLKPLNTKGNP